MLHVSRRDFVLMLAATAVVRPSTSAVVHLTLFGDDGDARRGAEMSADEARHAAALFGGKVEFGLTRSAERARLCVAVGDASPVFMGLDSGTPCRRDTFLIAPVPGALAWHPSLTRFGADTLNKRYRARFQAGMTSAAWCGWFAVKCAWEAALRSRAGSGAELAEWLEQPTSRFDGHKGAPLYFDRAHVLAQPTYDERGEEITPNPVGTRCDWTR
jgi:hypothetical protein